MWEKPDPVVACWGWGLGLKVAYPSTGPPRRGRLHSGVEGRLSGRIRQSIHSA